MCFGSSVVGVGFEMILGESRKPGVLMSSVGLLCWPWGNGLGARVEIRGCNRTSAGVLRHSRVFAETARGEGRGAEARAEQGYYSPGNGKFSSS